MKIKVKIVSMVLAVVLCLVALCSMTGVLISGSASAAASTTLFDTKTKKFNKEALEKLLKQVSGDKEASVDNMDEVNRLAERRTTASDMRKLKVKKEAGEDILVRLGGFDWWATYLSTDDDGDTILTLWMRDSAQLKGKKYGKSQTFNSYGQAAWSSGWVRDNPSEEYPCNMYGTSYLSCVVLNNGGLYATSGATTEEYAKQSGRAFSLFTMEDGGLTDYLVTPQNVSWQYQGQSSLRMVHYEVPNENLSKEITSSGFFSSIKGSYNFAGKEGSDGWGDDYLWLPSLAETGCDSKQSGIWGTSQAQRYDLLPLWLRSGAGCNSMHAYSLYSFGQSKIYIRVDSKLAIRPALHLNLTKAAANVA